MTKAKLYDFEFNGNQYLQKTLKEIEEITGIQYDTLKNRLRKMSIQEAVDFKLPMKLYDFEFEGKKYKRKNLPEVSNITLIKYHTLLHRIKRMTIQEAVDFKPQMKLYDFEFDGKRYLQKNINQISKITGIRYNTILNRIKINSIYIQEAIDKDFVISKTGKYYTFEQVSEEFNLDLKQVKKLKNLGFTYEDFKNM